MPDAHKTRILLADDHATVREGLRLLLDAQPDMQVIGEANDGATAIAKVLQLKPDVLVLDVSMPGMNGLKAAEALRQQAPDLKILTLTRHDDDGYLHQLLRAGAAGYVLKQSRPAELLHAIRSISSGGRYLDPAVAGKVMTGYRRRHQDEGMPGTSLSARETEVVRLIAEPSMFACPECHGVLLRLKQAHPARFRCHTGHAYSSVSLAAAFETHVEDALWGAVRALEEASMLLREMARAERSVDPPVVMQAQAARNDADGAALRALLGERATRAAG